MGRGFLSKQTRKLERMKTSKKGQIFGGLQELGIGIASLTIVLIVVFLILSETETNTMVAADGNATAAVQTLAEAADTIPDWVPLVVIAVVGSLLIGLVMMFRRR